MRLVLLLALGACGEAAQTVETASAPEPAGTPVQQPVAALPGPPTRVFWGDTHVHTGWSADAGMDGAITSPVDAYRYALGEAVESNTGQTAQLSRPYDWFAVTDHSDGMGVINQIVDGNPEMMAVEVTRRWRDAIKAGGDAAAAAKSELIRMQSNGVLPDIVMDPKWMRSAWERTIEAAETFYQPGAFTTFIGYEWTVNAGGGDNLHRNVIYRDGGDRARQMLPLTTFETQEPRKLWEWMARYEAKTGGRLFAIPHNGNCPTDACSRSSSSTARR